LTAFNSRLLTPPSEEEEIQLYRDPWRSVIREMAALTVLTVGVFVLVNYLGFQFPEQWLGIANAAAALFPVGLWLFFSLRPERRVPQPRQMLLLVFVISALVANAVAYPLIEQYLDADRWLSLASAIQRIVGYTFTTGIIQETLKYIVVRWLTWDEHLRLRADAFAYGAASAVAYATVFNLHFIGTGTPRLDVAVATVFSTVTANLVASAIVSYGLAESKLSNANMFVLPVSLGVSAVIIGLVLPLRAGLINASISGENLAFTLPRPLFGIAFSVFLMIVGLAGTAFFYRTAELREQYAALASLE
jgi:RsiW-degrading membrane proteinase PrsW (M82 family)